MYFTLGDIMNMKKLKQFAKSDKTSITDVQTFRKSGHHWTWPHTLKDLAGSL